MLSTDASHTVLYDTQEIGLWILCGNLTFNMNRMEIGLRKIINTEMLMAEDGDEHPVKVCEILKSILRIE